MCLCSIIGRLRNRSSVLVVRVPKSQHDKDQDEDDGAESVEHGLCNETGIQGVRERHFARQRSMQPTNAPTPSTTAVIPLKPRWAQIKLTPTPRKNSPTTTPTSNHPRDAAGSQTWPQSRHLREAKT